jgi:hypothetical protein
MLNTPLHLPQLCLRIHSILISPSKKFIIVSKDFSTHILNYPQMTTFRVIENIFSPSDIFCFSEDEKILVSSDSASITARNIDSLEILFEINKSGPSFDIANFKNKLLITRQGFIDVYEWNGVFVKSLVIDEKIFVKKIVIFDREHFMIMTGYDILIFKDFELFHKIHVYVRLTMMTKLCDECIVFSNVNSRVIIFNVKKLENVAKLRKTSKREHLSNPTFGLFAFEDFLIEVKPKLLVLWNWKMEIEIQTKELRSTCIEVTNDGRIFSGSYSLFTQMRIVKCDIQNKEFQDVIFEFEE